MLKLHDVEVILTKLSKTTTNTSTIIFSNNTYIGSTLEHCHSHFEDQCFKFTDKNQKKETLLPKCNQLNNAVKCCLKNLT